MSKQSFVKYSATILLVLTLVCLPVYFSVPLVEAQEEYPRDETLMLFMDRIAAPDVFNPFIPGNAYWEITGMCGEHLIHGNVANGTMDMVLATGWEYGPRKDTMKLFLRKGVTWSDGEPFTAEDVVFTFNMLKENELLAWHTWVVEWIKDISALDDHTVLIELNKPNPRFHLLLTFTGVMPPPIVPKHIWSKVENVTQFKFSECVWTGPYTLQKAESDLFIFKRRDDYWGPKPEPKWVIKRVLGAPEKQMLEQIAHAQDVAHQYTVGQAKDVLRKNPYTKMFPFMDMCVAAMFANLYKYPLSLREVRWAINYALNKTKMSQVIYEGISPIARAPWPEYLSLQKYIFNDVVAEYNVTIYDPQRAISILEDLGFERGADGVWVTPNGTRLSITLVTHGEWMECRTGAELAAVDLNAIGIETVVDYKVGSAYWDAYNTHGFDLFYMWYDPTTMDAYELFRSYDRAANLARVISGYRPIYNNTDYMDLCDQLAMMEPEDPEAQPIYKELLRLILRDLPGIPTIHFIYPIVFDNYYWTNWPSQENPYGVPYTWCPWFREILLKIKSAAAKPIAYTTVWFLEEVAAFMAVDRKSYGPFATGESASVPSDDAARLVVAGLASYSPPPPTGLMETVNATWEATKRVEAMGSRLSTDIAALTDAVEALSEKVSGLSALPSLLYATIALDIVVLIVVIAVASRVLRRSRD